MYKQQCQDAADHAFSSIKQLQEEQLDCDSWVAGICFGTLAGHVANDSFRHVRLIGQPCARLAAKVESVH